MSTYILQGPAHAAGSLSVQAPGGTTGDLAPTGQGVGLLVLNLGGTAVVVTLPVTAQYDGLNVSSRTVSVPPIAGAIPGIALIPLPAVVYGQGLTAINYSVASQVQVASVTIP